MKTCATRCGGVCALASTILFSLVTACAEGDTPGTAPWGYHADFTCEVEGGGAVMNVVVEADITLESAEFGRDDGSEAWALASNSAGTWSTDAPLDVECAMYEPSEWYLVVTDFEGQVLRDESPGEPPPDIVN